MVPLCKGPAPNLALSIAHTPWLAVLADVKALKRSEQRCRAELEAAGEQVPRSPAPIAVSCTAQTLGNSFEIQETSLKQVRSHNAELRRDVADMASTIERLTSLASQKGSASGTSKADEGGGSGGGGGSGSGAGAASSSSATGDHGGMHVAVESLQGVIRGLQREKQHMSEQLDRSVSESRLEAVQGELKSGMDALSCARGCYMSVKLNRAWDFCLAS